jgi:predicted mannosyl-3-phosphoglycerate phosphatase (HAD superfamily)
MKFVVFSDLDDTLLDRRTFDFEAARPGLELLKRNEIPLVLMASKTMEAFAVENGGAVFIPQRYITGSEESNIAKKGLYFQKILRTPFAEIQAFFRNFVKRHGAPFRALTDLSLEDVIRMTNLPGEQASKALARAYDLPFTVDSGAEGLVQLLAEEASLQGLTVVEGGRFFHFKGKADKGTAFDVLRPYYIRAFGGIRRTTPRFLLGSICRGRSRGRNRGRSSLVQEREVESGRDHVFRRRLRCLFIASGGPLSMILVSKLAGPPYHAGFFFPLKYFGFMMIPGVLALALLGALWIGPQMSPFARGAHAHDPETPKIVVLRALKTYIFVAALVLIGEGFKPLMIWYISKIPSWLLFWVNMTSAVLDNATLTAIEIGPAMALSQIVGIVMGLSSISGGMLIPGNIPNSIGSGTAEDQHERVGGGRAASRFDDDGDLFLHSIHFLPVISSEGAYHHDLDQ